MSMTARELFEAAQRGEGVLGRALAKNPDTPVFLLCAEDNLAADLVATWAIQAGLLVPSIDHESKAAMKVAEAKAIGEAMAAWPIHKNPVP